MIEFRLFFSISILASIALKRWNFPVNGDLKAMIAAKFLIGSHFLSIKNHIAIKNKLNIGSVKKYVTCIMALFIPFKFLTLHHIYSTGFQVLSTKLHA